MFPSQLLSPLTLSFLSSNFLILLNNEKVSVEVYHKGKKEGREKRRGTEPEHLEGRQGTAMTGASDSQLTL